jgi:hypothetical protein
VPRLPPGKLAKCPVRTSAYGDGNSSGDCSGVAAGNKINRKLRRDREICSALLIQYRIVILGLNRPVAYIGLALESTRWRTQNNSTSSHRSKLITLSSMDGSNCRIVSARHRPTIFRRLFGRDWEWTRTISRHGEYVRSPLRKEGCSFVPEPAVSLSWSICGHDQFSNLDSDPP